MNVRQVKKKGTMWLLERLVTVPEPQKSELLEYIAQLESSQANISSSIETFLKTVCN